VSITVFLADDHAVLRDGLRLVLEAQADMNVVGDADNGRDTVREVARLGPDIAIVDVTMPMLNGIEATRQIREATPSTKVVILSMHSSVEHVLWALDAGASGYVLKESIGEEVVNAVRAVYAGGRYLSKKVSDSTINEYLRERRALGLKGPLARLTSREREVLQLVAEGKSSAAIADILSLSPKTVETYRSRLMQKLGVRDIPGLVRFCILHGVTPLDWDPG